MGFMDMFIRPPNQNRVKDPVCGMTADLSKTAYKSSYKGKVYGFCSETCKKTFDEDPTAYAS